MNGINDPFRPQILIPKGSINEEFLREQARKRFPEAGVISEYVDPFKQKGVPGKWTPSPKWLAIGSALGLMFPFLEALEETFSISIGPKTTYFLGAVVALISGYMMPDPNRKTKNVSTR